MTDLTLNVTRVINAPIEKVFDAWLDPDALSKFILPMPGMEPPETQNEARTGGRFSIIMKVGEDKIPHTGTYLEIDRPGRLVFSWESPFSTDDSVVTIRFFVVDNDTTRVELNHVKFIDEESRSNHEGGWANILDALNQLMS